MTYGDARFGWREYTAAELGKAGIVSFSPMRHKGHLRDDLKLHPMGHPTNILSTPKGITARDRFDTTRCDLVLCNLLGSERVSIGSMIEFGWADAFRIPIVACMEPEGNLHDHAMVSDLTDFRCDSLDAAIETIKAILIPGV
jgi:hypothetical protein